MFGALTQLTTEEGVFWSFFDTFQSVWFEIFEKKLWTGVGSTLARPTLDQSKTENGRQPSHAKKNKLPLFSFSHVQHSVTLGDSGTLGLFTRRYYLFREANNVSLRGKLSPARSRCLQTNIRTHFNAK